MPQQSKPIFTLAEINASTILGKAIVDNWPISPKDCILTIRELYGDNPDGVRGIMGKGNIDYILKNKK